MKLAPKSDFVLSLGFVTNYLQLTWGKILNLPKDWTGQSLKQLNSHWAVSWGVRISGSLIYLWSGSGWSHLDMPFVTQPKTFTLQSF